LSGKPSGAVFLTATASPFSFLRQRLPVLTCFNSSFVDNFFDGKGVLRSLDALKRSQESGDFPLDTPCEKMYFPLGSK
jgi:hypothetical protein